MKNHYLDILELESGASKSDIKKAYRKLSKKYHPDINDKSDAKDKFIEIAEAYNFLSKVGPTPHKEKVNYDYDPYAEEYKNRRQKAREKARQQAEVEAKLKQKMYQQLIFISNIACAIVFAFNLLLAVDFYLPPNETKLSPPEIQKAFERTIKEQGYGGYPALTLDKFKITMDKDGYYLKKTGFPVIVQSTAILNTPLKVISPRINTTREYKQLKSVYSIFGPIISMVLLGGILYFFVLRAPDPKVYIAMTLVVLFLIQLYINNL